MMLSSTGPTGSPTIMSITTRELASLGEPTRSASAVLAIACVCSLWVGGMSLANANDTVADLEQTIDTNAVATVREVADGVYVRVGLQQDMSIANGGDIANTGFIVGRDSVVVIDPGGSVASGEAMRRAIVATTDLPISHLVLTHFHPDHVFGAAAFGDVETIVAHANHERARLQRAAFYAERFAPLLGPDGIAGLGSPTQIVAAGDSLEIDSGGRMLTVSAHPTGHTDNDLSVFDARTRTLWASDLLFAQRVPSLDGSLRGWLAVMDDLTTVNAVMVVPGHGIPASFASIAEPQRAYLSALFDDTRRRLDAGERLADAVKAAETADDGGWLLFDLQHPTNVTKAWTELEWD